MTRAALYARLSRDRSGEETATTRQLADGRALAAAKGWEVAGEYVDVDVSAYRNVSRPQYEAMVAEVEAGAVERIIAWKLDRLLRRPRDFEALWAVCEPRGAHIATVADGIDTSSPMVGLFQARLLTMFAEWESATLSARERRKHEDTARRGGRAGGGRRPFGLSGDWSTVEPAEAALVRDAVTRILAGESLYAIAGEWNGRAVRTPTGRTWTVQLVTSMLRSPRLAGLREHRGAIVGRGGFPAIVDEATHARLRAMLADPSRRRETHRRFLLSGLVRCGQCGATMYGRRRYADKARYYGCEKVNGSGACGGRHIMAEPLEALVAEAALQRLDSPAFAAALRAIGRHKAEAVDLERIQADEAALAQLARDHYAERIIGRGEYLAARRAIEERLETDRRRLARQNGTSAIVGLEGAAREAWPAFGLDRQRAILGAIIASVAIGPGQRGGNRFDPDRVDVEWRA